MLHIPASLTKRKLPEEEGVDKKSAFVQSDTLKNDRTMVEYLQHLEVGVIKEHRREKEA